MASLIVETLWAASLQGGVLALVVWAVCRAVPSLPASARTVLWWMVGVKLIVGLAWTDPIPVPVWRAAEVPSVAAAAAIATPGDDLSAPIRRAAQATAPAVASPPQGEATDASGVGAQRARTWHSALTVAWTFGLCVVMAVTLRRLRATSLVVAQADPAPRTLSEAAGVMALRLGVIAPRVVVSDEVASPMVRGVRRPVVVLPREGIGALEPAALRMVLCHELVHVRRRDLWLGWIPELAARVFFFHPLAHLAVREYRLAREAACDAEVLQTLGAEPRDYGRLLLTLGVVRREPVLAAAAASRSFSDMKRRLQMLNHFDPTPRTRRIGRVVLGCAAVALIPIQLVARPPAAPTGARIGDVALAGPIAQALPDPTGMFGDPLLRAHVETAQASTRHREARDFEWLILRADGDTMSGTHDARERARRFQRNGEPLWWVKIDGQEYVIRDPKLVREAEASFDEVEAIGRQMGEIGGAQGKLGARQAAVGAQQAEIGARQAELGAKIGALAQKQVALAMERVSRSLQETSARREERASANAHLSTDERTLEQQMKDLRAQIDALSDEIEQLVKPMEEYGRQMEPHAARLREMGKQIEAKAAEAEAKLRTLAQQAIASGKADAVK